MFNHKKNIIMLVVLLGVCGLFSAANAQLKVGLSDSRLVADEINYLPATGTVATSTATNTPIISNLKATVGVDRASVTWNTNVFTDSIAYYTKKGNSSWSWQGSSAATSSHSVSLPGLAPFTTYQYYVNAKSLSGANSISETKEFMTATGTVATGTVVGIVKPNLLDSSIKDGKINDSKLVDVSATENKIIDSKPTVVSVVKKYGNGTLIKVKGDVKIYVIKDGKKNHIKSLIELKQYRGKIISINSAELKTY